MGEGVCHQKGAGEKNGEMREGGLTTEGEINGAEEERGGAMGGAVSGEGTIKKWDRKKDRLVNRQGKGREGQHSRRARGTGPLEI